MAKKLTGVDEFGFKKSGRRSWVAKNCYRKKGGMTTPQVKVATEKKYGKPYAMLNMLKPIRISKKWDVKETAVMNKASKRDVTAYEIVTRDA